MKYLKANNTVENTFNDRLEAFVAAGQSSELFAIEFALEQYHLDDAPTLALVLLVELTQSEGGSQVCVAVSDQTAAVQSSLNTELSLDTLAEQLRVPTFNLAQPLRLEPIAIPKPWGQEIWYTGIESRGVSLFTDGRFSTPIHWLLEALPQRLVAGAHRQLNLLKILDPLPEEVYGDLYFELHEQKQEVYVVTHVDQQAWPDATGAIRFGFDSDARQRFGSDDEFRAAFSEAVKAYEVVRREIDGLFDQCRQQEGLALDEPVSADKLQQWHQQLPEELIDREREQRAVMNGFTAMRPLQVGDVVKVPTYTPHALQHGVRTVEFQTPVYERKILSFAQKVLTQSHWDTDEAVAMMALETPEQPPLQVLVQSDAGQLEEVVRFDDFWVRRLTLAAGQRWQLASRAGYQLVMSVNGGLVVDGADLSAEQAVLLTPTEVGAVLEAASSEPAIALIAEPV